MAKMKFLLREKIDRARDGRSQTWIIAKMADRGVKMSDAQFSRKKNGHDKFRAEELEVLSEILNTELT